MQSLYFNRLFFGELAEGARTEYELEGVGYEDFVALLEVSIPPIFSKNDL